MLKDELRGASVLQHGVVRIRQEISVLLENCQTETLCTIMNSLLYCNASIYFSAGGLLSLLLPKYKNNCIHIPVHHGYAFVSVFYCQLNI